MYYSRYASRDVKQKFQFVPAKDVPPEYNPVDRAFESSLRSDFNSSSELFIPLSQCELFYAFHLQFVIKSVSSVSAVWWMFLMK